MFCRIFNRCSRGHGSSCGCGSSYGCGSSCGCGSYGCGSSCGSNCGGADVDTGCGEVVPCEVQPSTCGCRPVRNCCYCPPCPPQPVPPAPTPTPTPTESLSCFLEARGTSQIVASQADVKFNPAAVETAGTGITLGADGSTFTITRAGLYHVEWTLTVAVATQPVMVGLFEDGELISVQAMTTASGILSSGALIKVTADSLPYTFSLRSIGGAIDLTEPTGNENVSASIRIARFADRAN